MHGIEWNVQKEGLLFGLTRDDAFCFRREKVGRITFFLNRFLISVPIVNRKSSRRVVDDCLGVVIDTPGVVPILMHEPLRHGQVFVQPLAAMPLANQAGKIPSFFQRLGDRSFA